MRTSQRAGPRLIPIDIILRYLPRLRIKARVAVIPRDEYGDFGGVRLGQEYGRSEQTDQEFEYKWSGRLGQQTQFLEVLHWFLKRAGTDGMDKVAACFMNLSDV